MMRVSFLLTSVLSQRRYAPKVFFARSQIGPGFSAEPEIYHASMRFGGFDWDSGNLSKCVGHGVSLAEIEALFAGDVYIVRDAIVSAERWILGFGDGADRWIFCVFTWRGNRIRPVSGAVHAREGGQALCRRSFPT
jgi:uncharacterized protein